MRVALAGLVALVAVACGTTAPPLDGGADAAEEIDCSSVGCAMSPGCGQVCTAVCGCCGCPYGATCGTCDAGAE